MASSAVAVEIRPRRRGRGGNRANARRLAHKRRGWDFVNVLFQRDKRHGAGANFESLQQHRPRHKQECSRTCKQKNKASQQLELNARRHLLNARVTHTHSICLASVFRTNKEHDACLISELHAPLETG